MTVPVVQRMIELVTAIMRDQLDLDADGDVEIDLAAVTESTSFADLGVDSLVLVEVAVMIRSEFGVEVTDEELVGSETFGGAAELVELRRVATA